MAEAVIPGIAGEFVELRTPNGGLTVGRLVPRDGCVIAVTVPSAAVSSLQPGDRIELGSLPPLELLRLRGTVVKTDHTGARSLVLFNACTGTFHWHPHFVERRNAVRVRPSPLDPVAATIHTSGAGLRGRVRDLSIEGAAVVVDHATLDDVAVPADADVTLRLPRSSDELRFAARLLRSEQVGSSVVHALCFDVRRSSRFTAQQKLLHGYVLRRQTEMVVPLDRREPHGGRDAAG